MTEPEFNALMLHIFPTMQKKIEHEVGDRQYCALFNFTPKEKKVVNITFSIFRN